MWPDRTLLDLFAIELPILQAPMAGASGTELALAVAKAGGLASLPFAMLDVEAGTRQLELYRQQTDKPVNINFFCHEPQTPDDSQQRHWQAQLATYYQEFSIDPDSPVSVVNRAPFDEHMCRLVEQYQPEVVSFHFGLPDANLVGRVKAAGSRVLSSATTVAEARWLEQHGCDAIIAQGLEAGGHRGLFLDQDLNSQMGTLALVPQIVDAVSVPVIAAGGIADGRGVAAAMVLGASAVQIGTAFLSTPEAQISDLHRQALCDAGDNATALTNIFSGRPARGLMNRAMRELGPLSPHTPVFPTAGAALAPLKQLAEAAGNADFSSLWAGQGAALLPGASERLGATELTLRLGEDALTRLPVKS